MINEIVSAFIRWAIPFICCGVTGIAVATVKSQNKRYNALENGLKSLLRSEIIRAYEKYTERGHCPIYAREPLTKAYEAYHALGGNSTATSLYEKTMQLPTEIKKGG